jgi:hypothetical protein
MKKLILVFSAILISLGSFASYDLKTVMNQDQDTTQSGKKGKMKNHKMGKMNQDKMGKMEDGVMMKDGKMMMSKNGKIMPMDNEITLDNGTKVMTDGTYIDKNGTSMRMKNGDHFGMSGKMIPMKKNKMK